MCSCRAPRVTRGAAGFPACESDGTPEKLAKYPSRSTRITRRAFRGHIGTNVACLLRVALARPAIHKELNWVIQPTSSTAEIKPLQTKKELRDKKGRIRKHHETHLWINGPDFTLEQPLET